MGSPTMKLLTKRTLPILFGIVSLFSSTRANGHVQNSDDTIEIESDDIQLRWLDKSTMQIIWTGKKGMEDGGGNEDSSNNGLFSQSSTKSLGESADKSPVDNSETASSDTTASSSNTENNMDNNDNRSETADVEGRLSMGSYCFSHPPSSLNSRTNRRFVDLEESLKTILWLEPLLLDVKQRNSPLLILILVEDSTF